MAELYTIKVKILVEPRFYFEEGDVNFFMSEVQNTEEVDTKIIDIFHNIFSTLPLTAFKRITDRNFYIIDAGEIYPVEAGVLFRRITAKQHKVKIDTAIQGHQGIDTILHFNVFDKFPEDLTNPDDETIYQFKDIKDADLADEEFRQQLMAKGTNLSRLAQLNVNSLDDMYLPSTYLLGANFSNSSLESCIFTKAKLLCANFTKAVVNQTEFEHADLRYADFSGIKRGYETQMANANLQHTLFVGTEINGMICYKADFYNANCRGAVFHNGNFRGAKFIGADLTNADFRGDETDLAGADFRRAILINAKFNGTNWEESIYDDDMIDADHDTEYIEEEEEEEAEGDEAEADEEDTPSEVLPPLPPLDPYTPINNSTITYNDVLKMLNPAIKNVMVPASKMELHKWYRVSDPGDTPAKVWNDSGVPWKTDNTKKIIEPKKLDTEKAFKCVNVPVEIACEGLVYESTPECMAVHELSEKLNKPELVEKFSRIVGKSVIDKEMAEHYNASARDSQELLKHIVNDFETMLKGLLHSHNAEDGGAEGWTKIYDTAARRNTFINHALYHKEEGLIKHPFFVPDFNGEPVFLLSLMLFIKTLPMQMQVYWAQVYMQQFITGYGQTLEEFDPTKRMPPYNFIASCINGNIEKLFLSIGSAISNFIDGNLIQETEREKQENLKQILAKNVEAEFETYYGTTDDPTVEGYLTYLKDKEITADFTAEKKAQYLTILNEDAVIQSKLKCFVHRISGGGGKRKGKKYTRKIKKNIKQGKKYTKKGKKNTKQKGKTSKKYTRRKNKNNKKT
jgi:uncharacterized protein YjbI with pentapeptide repeats